MVKPSKMTHYQVLGLTKRLVDEAKDPQRLVKRAYHRALLQHHPDKSPSSSAAPASSKNPSQQEPVFTVDQISTASTILSSPATRHDYDKALLLQQRQAATAATQQSDFQTGIETLDLDDLDFDEGGSLWYRGCRCGNPRGFELAEDDLEAVAEDGELVVGCQDCSLWLKVHFAVIDG